MCACEEDFAHRFLPHQLSEGTDLETQRPIKVTIGFQENICNTCRGLPEEAHPLGEIYGRSSKIHRYYWREITFETTRRFADWAERQGYADERNARAENPDAYASIGKEVVNEINALHEHSPKYVYQEESQSAVIKRHKVEVVKLEGAYVTTSERKVGILENGEVYSAEKFATLYYTRQGYEVLLAESIPFHVLFGVFMWLLIQAPSDPRGRVVGFGERTAFDEGGRGKQVWTRLPEDFGSPGYAQRQALAIEEHFLMLPHDREELLWLFDYWTEPSEGLRQYLWAHRPEDVERARKIASVLPACVIHRILRYLVGDYWRRYTGWPDLLAHKPGEYFFAEVKSSRDKLREDQKNWIRANANELHLPFKLVKIHKQSSQSRGDK